MTLDADARDALLRWFHECRAETPWRRDPQPYQVWLSEVMLQQTRVETVAPYYRRFLAAFPTIEALANAPLDDVLKRWEGLGYYSRARNLHRAAKIVMTRHGGQLPRAAQDLLQLPGIGAYSAGAIASIAFGQPEPALDANATRVLTRLLDLADDITRSSAKKKLRAIAADWLPEADPGSFNQAVMELGQRVCRPRKPDCASCPLRARCRAWAAGSVDRRPVRPKRAPIPHFQVTAGLIRDERERFLIAQRKLDGLLGGLWEFPGGKVEAGESLQDCLRRELREELAIEVEVGERFTQVKHAFTHFKITLHAFDCRYLRAIPPYSEPQALDVRDWAWASQLRLADYSFGKADRLVIAELARRRGALL